MVQSPAAYRIHLATSDDCVGWERHPDNPLVVDGYEARDPMVLRVGDRWIMYYTATDQPAVAPTSWRRSSPTTSSTGRGAASCTSDPMAGTGAGPTESPFVVERGRDVPTCIGPDWEGLVRSHAETGRYDPAAYRRTRVLASDDPLSFSLEARSGRSTPTPRRSSSTRTGAWWVSHCGWGQGGVHLAPLRFR